MKRCPQCNTDCANGLATCPNCGYAYESIPAAFAAVASGKSSSPVAYLFALLVFAYLADRSIENSTLTSMLLAFGLTVAFIVYTFFSPTKLPWFRPAIAAAVTLSVILGLFHLYVVTAQPQPQGLYFNGNFGYNPNVK